MARGLYIGGKIGWGSVPPIDLLTGASQQIDLSAYLYNPRSRAVTYSAVGSLPTGCSISGNSFNWNGAGTVSTTGITLRATSNQYQVDTTATVDIASGANVGPEWDQYIGPFNVASNATVGTVVATMADYVTDPESDPLVITMNGSLPSGLSYDTDTTQVTVTGALTVGASSSVTFDADDDYSSAAGDWVARSTATGVIWAQLFEDEASVANYRFTNGVGLDLTPSPGSTGSYVRYLAGGGILGNGCLELEQRTDGNMSSYWCRPFNPALTQYQMTGAGGDKTAGQPFYLQVRVKTNCGGEGSTGGAGRKVFSVSRTENSYTWQEVVVQDTWYRGVFQMYQGMGSGNEAYKSFEEPIGGSDFNFQPRSEYAISPAYCSYQAGNYPNQAACWTWGDDEWITYMMYVLPATDQQSNGHVTMWVWKPGMSGYVKVMDKPNLYMRYDTDKTFGFNAALLWIYETGRTAGPSNQKQWYDQVILSTQPIACPTS
jgi:hypothetical protein